MGLDSRHNQFDASGYANPACRGDDALVFLDRPEQESGDAEDGLVVILTPRESCRHGGSTSGGVIRGRRRSFALSGPIVVGLPLLGDSLFERRDFAAFGTLVEDRSGAFAAGEVGVTHGCAAARAVPRPEFAASPADESPHHDDEGQESTRLTLGHRENVFDFEEQNQGDNRSGRGSDNHSPEAESVHGADP